MIIETEQGVALAILRGVLDFKREPWPQISENAKSLVRQMLEPDPKKRLTSQQVLGKFKICHLTFEVKVKIDINLYDIYTFLVEHPWIQNEKKASNVPLGDIVRTRLKQFSVMNRFKKKALRVSTSFWLLFFLFVYKFILNLIFVLFFVRCR